MGIDNVTIDQMRVYFTGDEGAGARACINLRSADRVFLHIKSFTAKSFDELFDGVYAIPWADYISPKGKIIVNARCVQSTIMSQSDTQSITKKAIIKSMQRKIAQEIFPESGEDYTIEVSILKDNVVIGMDLCGASLHKRGYRTKNAPAPLKESMAASLLLIADYNGSDYFCDPFCGSGTLPIEAALIARNIAPGLNRSFAAEKWKNSSKALWEQERQRARDLINPKSSGRIVGYDIDPKMIEMSKFHAQQAGVAKFIKFKVQDAKDLNEDKYGGTIVTNPPYGERLSTKEQSQELYTQLRYSMLPLLDWGWSLNILTANDRFERFFGKKADKVRRLFNGDIPCKFYQYFKTDQY